MAWLQAAVPSPQAGLPTDANFFNYYKTAQVRRKSKSSGLSSKYLGIRFFDPLSIISSACAWDVNSVCYNFDLMQWFSICGSWCLWRPQIRYSAYQICILLFITVTKSQLWLWIWDTTPWKSTSGPKQWSQQIIKAKADFSLYTLISLV